MRMHAPTHVELVMINHVGFLEEPLVSPAVSPKARFVHESVISHNPLAASALLMLHG